MMAAAHVMAASANALVLEFHARAVDWWTELADGAEALIEDGHIIVSDAPGIGVELDDAAAKRLLWNGDEYFTI